MFTIDYWKLEQGQKPVDMPLPSARVVKTCRRDCISLTAVELLEHTKFDLRFLPTKLGHGHINLKCPSSIALITSHPVS